MNAVAPRLAAPLGRDRLPGAILRAAAFLFAAHWLGAAWFRTVQAIALTRPQDPTSAVLHLPPFLVDKVGVAAVAVGLTLLAARLDRRSPGWCGTPLRAIAARRIAQGACTAIAAFSLVMAVMAALGDYAVRGWTADGATLLAYALGWGVLFALVAVAEELVFRGYALSTLAGPLGYWPAALVTSLWFGLAHAGNAFEDWQSEALLAVFALSACLVRRLTGSLWFLIGFHMFWDYTESIVFSVPDSGLISVGRLLDASLSGDPALTGGAVGPENSPITLGVDALVLIGLTLCFRKLRGTTIPAPA